jgi:hypothetical protein
MKPFRDLSSLCAGKTAGEWLAQPGECRLRHGPHSYGDSKAHSPAEWRQTFLLVRWSVLLATAQNAPEPER